MPEILPNVCMKKASRSDCDSLRVARPMSFITSSSGRMLPAASVVLTPNLASWLLVLLASSARMFLRSVPAIEALMPLLPNRPMAAAVSSSDWPALRATGATNLNDSPIISTDVLALVAVLAITSASRPIWSAERPKALPTSLAMSAAIPRSTAPARARSSTVGMPARICSVWKPAMPRNFIPSATWLAEKEVVRPSRFAVCSNF